MSAYIVGKSCIDALVTALMRMRYPGAPVVEPDVLEGTANFLGAWLWDENIRSVRYLYPEVTELPGPIPSPDPEGYEWDPAIEFRPEDYLDALKEWEYQSCELPDVQCDRALWQVLEDLKRAIKSWPREV